MPPDHTNIARLIQAARRRHQLTRAKAIRSLRELDHTGVAVTFEAVARYADVSRSWLYNQPDLRAEIERLREATRRAPLPAIPTTQRASDPSLLRRLQTANERNAQLTEENQRLRRQLAHALGDQRATGTAATAPSQRRTRRASATIGPC
jgi:Family of unknown function (DUF6262)